MQFSHEEYLGDLNNFRYAVKRFDASKKISDSDWHILEESLRLSPSSYGLQPWKFLIVQNTNLREQLKTVSWGQTQVTDCSQYVVFTTLKSLDEKYVDQFIHTIAQTRGVDASSLKGYRDAIVGDVVTGPRSGIAQAWTQRQAYIAMGNLMTTAAMMHIDTCPMEGLDPAAYDRILGLEKSPYATVAACAVGYRHAEDKYQFAKKVRFKRDQVIEVR